MVVSSNAFKIEDIVLDQCREQASAFTCAVCLGLPEEPVQTACQHIFCADCISPVFRCPTCRADFGERKGVPLRECNRVAMLSMQGLTVGFFVLSRWKMRWSYGALEVVIFFIKWLYWFVFWGLDGMGESYDLGFLEVEMLDRIEL